MNPVANSLRASEHPQGPKFFSFLSHSSTRLYFISSVRDVVTLRQSAPSPKYFLIRLFADGLLSVPPSKPCRCCGGSDYSFISCTRQAGGAGASIGKDTGCGCQGEHCKTSAKIWIQCRAERGACRNKAGGEAGMGTPW